MDGIKNKGYNNIELVNSLFTIELSDFLQGLADGTTFNLIDGETDIALGNIHSNYKVKDIVNFLVNGSFNNVGLKFTITEDDLPPSDASYALPFVRKSDVNEDVYFSKLTLFNGTPVQYTLNAYINYEYTEPYQLTILAETVTQS